MAAGALVEPLASVGGHLLGLRVLADGAGEHGGEGDRLSRRHGERLANGVQDVVAGVVDGAFDLGGLGGGSVEAYLGGGLVIGNGHGLHVGHLLYRLLDAVGAGLAGHALDAVGTDLPDGRGAGGVGGPPGTLFHAERLTAGGYHSGAGVTQRH